MVVETRINCKWAGGYTWRDGNVSKLDCADCCTSLYIYQKSFDCTFTKGGYYSVYIKRQKRCLIKNLTVCMSVSSVAHLCPTLCDPMNRSTPGLPVHHQLPESTQTHVHQVGDAIQSSYPLPSLSPPAPNPSQHQGLFQWVRSLHQVAKVLEFQLQHQSFHWTPRTDLL